MAITEAPPEVEAAAGAATPVDAPERVPLEADTLLTTVDSVRVGRMWLGVALVLMLVGGIVGAVLGVERVDSGLDILDSTSFVQALSLHSVSTVFLFLVPAFIGLAGIVVPLQIGAANVAFPRAFALSFWAWAISGGILVASYATDGGPGGGDVEAVTLWITALIGVLVALTLAAATLLVTVFSMRAPGMTLRNAPMFSWSIFVFSTLLVVTLPVLVAALLVLFVVHTEGTPLIGPDGGLSSGLAWFFQVPQGFVLLVPVAGVVSDIVATAAKRTLVGRDAAVAGIGLLGLLSFAAHTQITDPDAIGEAVLQGQTLVVVIPVLVLLGVWAGTLREGAPIRAAVLAAGLAALGLAAAGLVGAVGIIDPLELVGTAWVTGSYHLLAVGAGVVGVVAAAQHWGPKIVGRPLSEGLGAAAAIAAVLGGVLLASPELGLGAQDLAQGASEFVAKDGWDLLSGLSVAGGLLALLAVLALGLNLVSSATDDAAEAGAANPWGGHTLEWATASPPPRGNFDTVPAISSPDPLAPDAEDPS